MKTCSCGNLIDDQSSRCAHCAALQLLGLEPEAAENEIRNAYRLLVKVWSPNRFEGDDALKESAAAKLKEINSAYEFLTSTSTERGPWRPPENMAPVATSQAQTKPPVAEKAASTVELTPIGFLNTKPSFRLWPAFRIIFIAVLIVVVIVVVKDAGIALNAPYSSGPMTEAATPSLTSRVIRIRLSVTAAYPGAAPSPGSRRASVPRQSPRPSSRCGAGRRCSQRPRSGSSCPPPHSAAAGKAAAP